MVKLRYNFLKEKNKKRIDGDFVFDIVNYIFLILCTLIVAYPLLYIISSSFSSPGAVIAGKIWLLPVDFDLTAYNAVFKNSQVLTGYINSLIYMCTGTLLSVILTILAAYPLSRKELRGKKIVLGLFLFTMLFSGGLIPTYMVIRNLGLINTRLSIILPNALNIWNLMITLTFFKISIADELYEVAKIEGACEFRILWSIVLPLSGPIIAVMTLYYAIGIWNSYFDALIYLKNNALYPLQIVLRNILIINQGDLSMGTDIGAMARRQGLADVMKYALIIVSSAPLLVIYPFVQKHFVKGVMLGSIKG